MRQASWVAQKANSRDELQKATGIKDREHFRKAYLEPLLSSGWLERTIPEKPHAAVQDDRGRSRSHRGREGKREGLKD